MVTLYGYKNLTVKAHAEKYNFNFALLNESEKPLTGISLKKTNIQLQTGKSSLNGVIYNSEDTTDDKTVIWTSSNSAVAWVFSNGKAKGIAPGTAVITARVGEFTATCTVTIL